MAGKKIIQKLNLKDLKFVKTKNLFVIALLIVLLLILALSVSFVKNSKQFKQSYAFVPGDCDTNGVVDLFDFQKLSNSFNLSEGDIGYNPLCNFNGDKTVDLFDFQILSNHYGETGPSATPPPSGTIVTPLKQAVMYLPPTWASNGNNLTDTDVANKFQVIIYSRNQMQSRLANYIKAGFKGDAMVYLIMDTIMGPPDLSSLSAQGVPCTDAQKQKSVNSNNAAMDTGDFCEIHDAIINQTALPDYPDIYPTENWFVHRSDGTRLESTAGPDATYKTNPGDKNWQEYYARRALRELTLTDNLHLPIDGVDGLFIDNVQLTWSLLLKSTNNQPPKEYTNSDLYAAAVVDFLKTVHTKLHTDPYSFPIWGNITPITATRSWSSVEPYLEGAMQESFGIIWGGGPPDVSTANAELNRAEAWVKSGRHFLAIAQGDSSGTYNKYVESLVLLFTDGVNASYKYRNYNGGSNEYYEIPDYYAKLGDPLEDKQLVFSNPLVYRRQFKCGLAQADLTNHVGTIVVTAGCTP